MTIRDEENAKIVCSTTSQIKSVLVSSLEFFEQALEVVKTKDQTHVFA